MEQIMGNHSKVFNDPIHGHIELPELCVKIIDTPYVQRLRNIKQIGTCYLVYPGASHNRFEHSLGNCYLAGKLLNEIRSKQENMLDPKDILCVQVAGLCHDLGQGPFSRLFEKKFMPNYIPGWKFEDTSVDMFKHILTVKDGYLRHEFERLMPDFEEKDITFITEMISSKRIGDMEDWPFEGRGREKAFLYEVVTNKSTGIDVDRWDYLARDSYMLGMKNIFDFDRCIANARVLEVDNGRTQICFRDKEAQDVYDMFYTRMTLHRRAYQHKTNNIITQMICDALQKANDNLKFEGKNGQTFRLSDSVQDMEAFSKVTDDVLTMIHRSHEKELKESKEIIQHVLNRQLYKCVGQTQIKRTQGFDDNRFKESLYQKITNEELASRARHANGFSIDIITLNYGLDDKDPLKNVRFYTKDKKDDAKEINSEQVSYVLPETFSEKILRVYCKDTDRNHLSIVKRSFAECCNEEGLPEPKDK